MNIEGKKPLNEQNDLLCISCKSFFGSQHCANMCSQCYKQNQAPKRDEKVENELKNENAGIEEEKQKQEKKEVNRDRCLTCNRKLKLLGIECKCGYFYCNHHRLPEDHSCTYNHKEAGKQRLSKQIVKVEKAKIESI